MENNGSYKMRMRDTWVEIDLDNIKNNLNRARKIVSPETKIAAVIKANAYGHGAIHIAKTLIESHADMLCVACLSEALELRRHFMEFPILIMGYTPDEQLEIAVKNNITMTVFSIGQARKINEISNNKKKAVIHIKVDTGFNRLGLKAENDTADIITEICKMENVMVEGIFTHLALKTQETDRKQFCLFIDIINELDKKGVFIPIKHICDSIAMVRYPDYHLDMVRPGAFIYGMAPTGSDADTLGLKQALTFKTKVSYIKELSKGEGVGYDYAFVAGDKCTVGTLPVGYADGYMRCLGGKGDVIINGTRAPIIGKMCMDQCMVDLSRVPSVKVGDEAILIGGNLKDRIPVSEVAEKAGTNRNEILAMISRRVPRVYVSNTKVIHITDYLLDDNYPSL